MKRQFNYLTFMYILACCLIGFSSLYARGVQIGDLEFSIYYGKDAYVDGIVGDPTSVAIPEKICYQEVEYPVTTIYYSAFKDCTSLTDIIIPNSITEILDDAFSGCTGLTEISIPNSITKIGDRVFDGCSNLKQMIIEDGESKISLGYAKNSKGLFYYCPLETVYVGRDLSFGDSPFTYSKSIASVNFSGGVRSIPSYTFKGCSGLTEVTIGSTVSKIENFAFEGCNGLKNLIIEDSESCLTLGYAGYSSESKQYIDLFHDCPLEKLYLGRQLSYIVNPFSSLNTLTTLTFGNFLTSINSSLFKGCCGLGNITFGNSISTIGSSAFEGCTGLRELTIGNAVNTIEHNAFKGCTGLTGLIFGEALSSVGYNAFNGCDNLQVITSYALNIDGIEEAGISSSLPVRVILNNGLEDGVYTTDLKFFDQLLLEVEGKEYVLVRAPETFLFTNCIGSKDGCFLVEKNEVCITKDRDEHEYVEFREKVIDEDLYSEQGFSFEPSLSQAENRFVAICELNCPKEITLTQAGTLFDKVGLQDIEKVDKLIISVDLDGTDIMTINRMTALRILDISEANIVAGGATYRDNLKTQNNEIGSYFFNGTTLAVLRLPSSVTTIAAQAFYDLNSLKYIQLGDRVKNIKFEAFTRTSLVELTIPSSVETIGYRAFQDCNGLKSLIIEDGEKTLTLDYQNSVTIRQEVFKNCPLERIYLGRNLYYVTDASGWVSPFDASMTLSSLTIGNLVTSLDSFAFSGCSKLREVKIPGSVTSIGSYAFSGCTGLSEMTIPNSVNSLGNYVFSGCSALTEVTLPTALPSIGNGLFNDCSSLSQFAIPNTVSSIGAYAFSGCTGLTEMIIPNSVASIGSYAFSGCTSLDNVTLNDNLDEIQEGVFQKVSLKEIEIPSKVTSIGAHAFRGCSQLEKVILPASLTKVGAYAFGECPAIKQVYSLNTTPPEIDSSTFDTEVEENAKLHVRKGSLVYYWLDPVWKEFKDMSEDLLCLDAIPNATYGDGEIDLSQYAPADVKLRYETSNSDVVEIKGDKMRIVGAGEATVGAILDEEGSEMELMGQMRQFVVDKADLEITVPEITIEQGQELPDFELMATGLQYDDTLDDIDELPQPQCEVDENSPVGEYPIYFTEGNDRNYNIATKASRVIVSRTSGAEKIQEEMIDSDSDSEVEVYSLNGMLVYKGSRKEAQLERGVYIVRQGKVTAKIMIK